MFQRKGWGAPSQPTTVWLQSFLSCTFLSPPSKPDYAFFLHLTQKGSPVCLLARSVQEGNASVPRCNCIKGENPLSCVPCTVCPGCQMPLCPTCRDVSALGRQNVGPDKAKLNYLHSLRHTQCVPLLPITWLSTHVLVCSHFRHVHVLGTRCTNINE